MPIVYEVCGIVAIETPSSLHTGRPARLPIQSWSAPSSAILAPCGPSHASSEAVHRSVLTSKPFISV